jgi:hypothetical protein
MESHVCPKSKFWIGSSLHKSALIIDLYGSNALWEMVQHPRKIKTWFEYNNHNMLYFHLILPRRNTHVEVCSPKSIKQLVLVDFKMWKYWHGSLSYWSNWQKEGVQIVHMFPIWIVWDANELLTLFAYFVFLWIFPSSLSRILLFFLLLPRIFLSSGVLSSSWIVHHKYFRPSTTTKLTILTFFFHIRVVTTSKLTIFFHPRVVTTSKLIFFFVFGLWQLLS